jgi:hypothetical protein
LTGSDLESGISVHNAMRVVPNGERNEFVFTLIRRLGRRLRKI